MQFSKVIFMKQPLGLNLIIKYYSIIGGLTLALSFFQLLSINNYLMTLIFVNPSLEFIAQHTILSIEFLKSLPESLMLIFAFIFTITTSIFHTLLAEAFYLNNGKAFIFGILFHSFSAVSSFTLWVLGVKTLKLIGFFFLFMNLIKAIYLYSKKMRGELPDSPSKFSF
jgi:hypothetical protein